MTEDGTQLPLPGLYVLDSDGGFLASTSLRSLEGVLDLLGDPEERKTASAAEDLGESEAVSIRVSGFMAAEGIT